jgi:hypothetical protein
MKLACLLISAAVVMTLGQNAFAKPYDPQALLDLVDQVQHSAHQGHTPIVMFDLDDTLTNTRDRNLRIFHEFAAQAGIQNLIPE